MLTLVQTRNRPRRKEGRKVSKKGLELAQVRVSEKKILPSRRWQPLLCSIASLLSLCVQWADTFDRDVRIDIAGAQQSGGMIQPSLVRAFDALQCFETEVADGTSNFKAAWVTMGSGFGIPRGVAGGLVRLLMTDRDD